MIKMKCSSVTAMQFDKLTGVSRYLQHGGKVVLYIVDVRLI